MPKGKPYLTNDCDRLRLEDGLAYRIPIHQIAERIGVPERTLRRHYPDVFEAAALEDGRKQFQPTDAQREIVMLAAGVGIPHDRIARSIGCGERTIEKHFVDELKRGSAQANLKVGGSLFKMATGDVNGRNTLGAARWWSKARMGWTDCPRIANTEPVGAPATGQVVVILPDNGRGDTSAAVAREAFRPTEPGGERSTAADGKAALGDDRGLMQDIQLCPDRQMGGARAGSRGGRRRAHHEES
jgi:hypothetical protein